MLYDLGGITSLKTSLLENCYSRNVLNIMCLFSFCCFLGSYEKVTQEINCVPPAVGLTWAPRTTLLSVECSGNSCGRDFSVGRD